MKLPEILRSRKSWIAIGGGVLLIMGALVTTVGKAVDTAADPSRPVFDVQRGPLTISVSVSGTIQALDQEIITNEVEGQTTILYIIPEGQQVKKGDLLVELDGSKLQDNLVDQEIKTQNAEAAHVNARESLEVVKNQAQADVEKAQLVYTFAQEDKKKFIEGDYPLQDRDAQAKVTLATGDMKRAQEKLDGSRRLAEKNYITTTELEADQQSALKAQLDLEMAEEQQKLLKDFEYKRQLAQLESDEKQAGMALDREKRKASADVVQAEADLKAKELEHEREQSKLDKLKEQLEKTKIYAPREGLVVYATTGQRSFHGDSEPLAEGQTVRERQELIYLPTTDSYQAEVKVHESSLAKVHKGLPVTLSVDALPGHAYRGVVDFIAPLPDAQSVWMNPDLKVYNTDIRITSNAEGLRTGMSCRGEILVQEFKDAVYVPVQSVVRESGVPTVYVVNGQKVERHKVAIGLDNNRMVQVTDGLKQGETVLLAPPLAADELGANPTAAQEPESGASAPADSSTGMPAETSPTAAPNDASSQQPTPAPDAGDAGGTRAPNASPDQGDSARSRFQNATPEEREQMRKQWQERMQNMSPEERAQMQERMQRRSRGDGGSGGQRRSQ